MHTITVAPMYVKGTNAYSKPLRGNRLKMVITGYYVKSTSYITNRASCLLTNCVTNTGVVGRSGVISSDYQFQCSLSNQPI